MWNYENVTREQFEAVKDRVEELLIECGSYDELMKNIMEDVDPFPYDLSDEELRLEVEVALGLKEYPEYEQK